MNENVGTPATGRPGGEAVLGRGQSNGFAWELLYWPEFPMGPQVLCGIIGTGWGSQAPSESLGGPFGKISTSTHEKDYLLVHGEVQATFDRVTIECEDGSKADATIVDCSSRFGFNYYVVVLPSRRKQVVATSVDGSHAVR